jgi:hypothetical protein
MPRRCFAAHRVSIRESARRPSTGRFACSRKQVFWSGWDFGDGPKRYEEAAGEHHDHLIDIDTGAVIEFHNAEIERLQEEVARKLGFKLVDHRMELRGVKLDRKK